MTNIPIISTDLVLLDDAGRLGAGADKAAVIGRLAGLLADAGRSDDGAALARAALAREAQSATGLPGGIAIPHCRSAAVREASIAFARLNPPVDFGAGDGPADLVFLIAAPEAGGTEHMKLLSSLAGHWSGPSSCGPCARRPPPPTSSPWSTVSFTRSRRPSLPLRPRPGPGGRAR